MDLTTITQWLTSIGWTFEHVDETTLRLFRREGDAPRFYLRLSAHWILLAYVHVIDPGEPGPKDLSRRLLAVNRDLRLAKFGYDDDGEVTLTAELPTESLQRSELRDAIERMVRYVSHYQAYFTATGPE